jgi:hypothetical protein
MIDCIDNIIDAHRSRLNNKGACNKFIDHYKNHFIVSLDDIDASKIKNDIEVLREVDISYYISLQKNKVHELNTLHVDSMITGNLMHIANVIYECIKDKIIYSEKKSGWFKYNEISCLWEKNENIDQLIAMEMHNLFQKIFSFLVSSDMTHAKTLYHFAKKSEDTQMKHKNIVHIVLILKNKLLSTKDFDCNKNLFAFTNGVYDFSLMKFRQLKSSDMITFTCGYNFVDDYKNKKMTIEIITSLFENVDEYIFFMKVIAMSMCGKSLDFLTLFHWKKQYKCNIFKMLLIRLFGNYAFMPFDLDEYMQKYKCSQEFISHTQNKRIMFIQDHSMIQNIHIDKLIGNNMICYEKNGNYHHIENSINTICMCENMAEVINKYNSVADSNDIIILKSSSNNKKINNCVTTDMFLLLLDYVNMCKQNNFILEKSERNGLHTSLAHNNKTKEIKMLKNQLKRITNNKVNQCNFCLLSCCAIHV